MISSSLNASRVRQYLAWLGTVIVRDTRRRRGSWAPLGLTLRDWYMAATTHLVTWDKANDALKKGEIQASLLGALLAARDPLGQVILGDPTVLLPAPS